MLFVALVAVIGFTSCSSDDDSSSDNCVTLLQNVEDAADAYFEDLTSVEKCNALRSALQSAINADCGTEEELEDAQDTLDLLTCDE